MTADTVGGVWTYALELSRALAARRVEVVLATMGAPLSPSQAGDAARIRGLHVRESTWLLEWMDDPWRDVDASCEWLLGLERELAPDVVHLNTFSHGALPWRRPPLVVGHSCVLSWWKETLGESAPAKYQTYRLRVRAGLQAAGIVAAPSRAMLNALDRYYGPFRRSAVIPNARHPSLFSPGRNKEPFILCAGRLWDRAKNLELLQAAARKGLPWPVFAAGKIRRPGGGEASSADVHMLGELDTRSLSDWMGRASLYVLPARYEPFGLSAVEAALSGCALVLGDIASLREVWGDAARFVPTDDVDALRETLRELTQDPVERVRLATKARERALSFTPAAQASSYLSLYAALAAPLARTREAASALYG